MFRRVTALAGLGMLILGVLAVRGASTHAAGPCGMQLNDQPVVFCETFDTPAGTGNRSGDLDGTLWGVSRNTGNLNFGQPFPWAPAHLDLCGTIVITTSASDVRICNGQMREATNDGESVTVLAAYPKQPFNFAGRTGTVSFDVTDDSQGNHAAWPEFWITDKPLPAPFVHEAPAGYTYGVQNAVGLRFATVCDGNHVGLDSAMVVRNGALVDSFVTGGLDITTTGCVNKASGPNGAMNHVEVRISQTSVEVYMSDPGSTNLVHVGGIVSPNLTFTQGLIWIEDGHYNGNKFGGQGDHTFAWDNVAFDGPATYRDLTYDVLDSQTPNCGSTSWPCLGWEAAPARSLTTLPIASADIAKASACWLMFTFWDESYIPSFNYTINGHAHSGATTTTSTFDAQPTIQPVPCSDLVDGPQTVTISANATFELANVDILLVAAASVPGGPTSTPTSIAPSATATSTAPTAATSTPTPPPTPTATASPTASFTPTSTPTQLPTPTPIPSQVCRLSVRQPNGTFANVNGTLQPFGSGRVCVIP